MMKNRVIIIFLLISVTIALHNEGKNLSLSLYNYNIEGISFQNYSKASNPLKPMALSMLVPGLGQYLQGNKKKAWFFFGVELLSITANRYYSNQADKDVLEYKNFTSIKYPQYNIFEDYIDKIIRPDYCR